MTRTQTITAILSGAFAVALVIALQMAYFPDAVRDGEYRWAVERPNPLVFMLPLIVLVACYWLAKRDGGQR